ACRRRAARRRWSDRRDDRSTTWPTTDRPDGTRNTRARWRTPDACDLLTVVVHESNAERGLGPLSRLSPAVVRGGRGERAPVGVYCGLQPRGRSDGVCARTLANGHAPGGAPRARRAELRYVPQLAGGLLCRTGMFKRSLLFAALVAAGCVGGAAPAD